MVDYEPEEIIQDLVERMSRMSDKASELADEIGSLAPGDLKDPEIVQRYLHQISLQAAMLWNDLAITNHVVSMAVGELVPEED